jgi:hypothetical protein
MKEADILVTATSAQAPLLKASWMKPGSFYSHVGGWEDEYAVAKQCDKIVCDDWETIKHRTQTLSRMYKDGELTSGFRLRLARRRRSNEKVPLTWKNRTCLGTYQPRVEGAFPVKNSARTARVMVSADGRGLVFQAGAVLLWETMRVAGLGRGLSTGLDRWRAPSPHARSCHEIPFILTRPVHVHEARAVRVG